VSPFLLTVKTSGARPFRSCTPLAGQAVADHRVADGLPAGRTVACLWCARFRAKIIELDGIWGFWRRRGRADQHTNSAANPSLTISAQPSTLSTAPTEVRTNLSKSQV
jgi:hypothetical protein